MKHHNKLTTAGGFRLIRAFSVDHNARRLIADVDRLGRHPDMRRFARQPRLRRRFSSRFNMGAGNV